jgi:hypothetical protein
MDIHEYAKTKGFEFTLIYEDEKTQKKPEMTLSTEGSYSDKAKKFNNPTNGNKKPYQGKNQPYRKNNYNNNSQNYMKPMTFSNKFDSINSQYGGGFYNPFAFPQQMPMNMTQPMYYQQPNHNQQEEQDGDKSASECLEYYFSEENLNKDSYIRSRMNEDGLIDAQEIANFNKMKNRGITVEKIEEILKNSQDSVIETSEMNGRLFLRNKFWDSFKDNLVPLDKLQMQRKMNKKYQTNYVNMQNNYFYQMTPNMYTPGMYVPYDNMNNMNMYVQPSPMGYPVNYPMGMMQPPQFMGNYAEEGHDDHSHN